MSKILRNCLLASPAMLGLALGVAPAHSAEVETIKDRGIIIAQAATEQGQILDRLNNYSQEGQTNSLEQVTNVNQLRDVSPTDWAYEALRSLVDRYGCIVGYPNQTYRGNRALSRYEFAAGLNACLNQIERLIAASEAIAREDIDTLNRLTQEFEAELATLSGRVDNLESRTAFLEDHQFSTTTKLEGEVVFGLAQEFNRDGNQAVFQDRVRLNFVSSFTGKDALYTRLDAGNATAFENIDQGAFTYSFDNDNNVEIGWLAYYFPIGEKIQVYLPAAFPLWVDFVPSVSPYLDSFTGATGSLSSFGESSPIYKIGLASGGGIGANYDLLETLTLSAGYFGGNSFDPSEGNGLFNGEYSALGQITWTPTDKLQVAATYVRAYFTGDDNTIFDLGVGTENARSPYTDVAITTNSFGLEGSYQITPRIAINAFGMFTDADQPSDDDADTDIWSYGVGLAFPDLGKEGNLGGVIVGAEPYVGGCDGAACRTGGDDVALHVEGFYKYQLNDNISVTPGIIYITAPFGDSDEDGGVIGSVRTTFTF
ncbi:MAG: iron uptake porin [Xenococcaceae cyanobacterium MO_188.B32]|nr:iron uptake porin [Xenococcaceae cyanobacterium MO_188.B32]